MSKARSKQSGKRPGKQRIKGFASKVHPRRVSASKRHARAVEMRVDGYTLQEIADRLGYAGPQGVHDAILSGLRETQQAPANELRKIEVDRLDKYLRRLRPAIARGSFRAIETALKLATRRAKLLGLDEPEKQEIEHKGLGKIPTVEDLQKLVDKLEQEASDAKGTGVQDPK